MPATHSRHWPNVAVFRGDLLTARTLAARAAALAEAAGDLPPLLMSRCDLAIWAAHAGDDTASADQEHHAMALADQMGSPTARAWAAYAAGERRAAHGRPDSADYLERAVTIAEQVGAAFVAGLARHTLLTTTARADGRLQAVSQFEPLPETWHGMGAWTQLWIAVRALVETLAHNGEHRAATLLRGAMRANPRASDPYGPDAARLTRAETRARSDLGPEFDLLLNEGAALDDVATIALARQSIRALADN